MRIKFQIFTGLFLILLSVFAQKISIKQLSSKKFNNLISENNIIILDVRTTNEFKNGHIKNAGQLNFYTLDFRRKLLLLPKDQAIYLYCNTGYRSYKAAIILVENGYTNVNNLEHGIMEWELENFSISIDIDAKPDTDNKLNINDFQNLINSDSLVLIDFYAPWCAPCLKLLPIIDSLKLEYKNRIKIVKVNTDASKKLIRKLKITEIPFLLLYNKGQILHSKKGLISKQELQDIFDLHLKNLSGK